MFPALERKLITTKFYNMFYICLIIAYYSCIYKHLLKEIEDTI